MANEPRAHIRLIRSDQGVFECGIVLDETRLCTEQQTAPMFWDEVDYEEGAVKIQEPEC